MRRKVYNKKEIRTRKLMAEKGINQSMIADFLGVSVAAINNRLRRGATEYIDSVILELDEMLKTQEIDELTKSPQ